MLEQVGAYVDAFYADLAGARCWVEGHDGGAPVQALQVRQEPRPLEDLLEVVRTGMDEQGLKPASAGHLAYIPGGGLFPSSLGDMIADVTNHYAGMFYPSPGAVRVENQMVRWMADLVGFPDTARGDLTSGGSVANLTGIVTAREARGVTSVKVPTAVIYRTEQVHHCVAKAIRIAGLSECVHRTVPMDARFRMDPDALHAQVEADRAAGLTPFLVVASAGTTDAGAVDPLESIADVCQAQDLWFHVDAAYGGFFVLTDMARDRLRGLDRADSVVLDPHKGLFLPYGSGAILVRDGEALRKAHSADANYLRDMMPDQDWFSPAHHSPELTRPFRGLRMWLPLHLFGVNAFRAALTEKLLLARYFHREVQRLPGLEVGPEPDLSVVTFRARGADQEEANRRNARLLRHLHQDGRVFLSSTTLDGALWIRLAVLCFRTHREHVDLALTMIEEGLEAQSGAAASSR